MMPLRSIHVTSHYTVFDSCRFVSSMWGAAMWTAFTSPRRRQRLATAAVAAGDCSQLTQWPSWLAASGRAHIWCRWAEWSRRDVQRRIEQFSASVPRRTVHMLAVRPYVCRRSVCPVSLGRR